MCRIFGRRVGGWRGGREEFNPLFDPKVCPTQTANPPTGNFFYGETSVQTDYSNDVHTPDLTCDTNFLT